MNSNQRQSISVLISFHNNQHFLDNLIQSILESNHQNLVNEIIVIDSASRIPPLLPQICSTPIYSIFNPLGSLTTSLNIGLHKAKSDWICILDCDTEIIEKDFWLIIDYMASNNLPVAVPVSLNSDITTGECFDLINTVSLGYLFSKRVIHPYLKSYYRRKNVLCKKNSHFQIPFFWNQCVILNSKYKNFFCYNENLHVWSCDFELSIRLRRCNINVYCVPQFKIIHHGEGSGSHDSIERMQGVLRGEFTYVSIVYKKVAFSIHLFSLLIRSLRLLARFFISPFSPKIYHDQVLLKSHIKLVLSYLFASYKKTIYLLGQDPD
jgi:glycosyltransferase involved in cell wall biosynthesis